MKIYNELESLGFFKWLKEKGFGSGFTPIILDAQPIDSIERSGYNAIAFRWFREKYQLDSSIALVANGYGFYIHKNRNYTNKGESYGMYITYEEAELACITALINIVEEKQN